jgi:hypothetical protein
MTSTGTSFCANAQFTASAMYALPLKFGMMTVTSG